MVHSDDVYFDKPGEKLSGEILGHARWAKIGLWNDDGTYSAAALLQWPKVSIFGIFRTYATLFLCPLRIFALELYACRCHQFGVVKVLQFA